MSGNRPPSRLEPLDKGFYSDMLNPNQLQNNENEEDPPETIKNLQWQSVCVGSTPKIENIPDLYTNGVDTRNKLKRKFAESSFLPKTQTPFYVAPGNPPRKLVIERKRREYLIKRDYNRIKELLEIKGVVTEKIKPDPEDIEKFCLPLEVFDNTDFDERIPSEWAALMPLPCTVFYNKDWTYGEVTKLISGSISNGSSGEWEVVIPETKETIRLPRLLILFEAEDPDVFINRLVDAYDRRAKVELLLQQQFYIDSMPRGQTIQLDENIENVVRAQYDYVYGVKKPVTADPDASSDILEDEAQVEDSRFLTDIMNEVLIEYQRCENAQVFKRESIKNSPLFEAMGWQYQEAEVYKPKKREPMPKYNYEAARASFKFSSLFTRPEVIESLGRVRQECNKVIDMQLFNTQTSKALKLEEFEQSQLSACNTVELYLKEPWPNACKGGVRSALQYMGKGCYDLSETSFDTYSHSKMFKLLNVIKFNMQDALRYLVENSCKQYHEMIKETCGVCVPLTSAFEWGKGPFS